MPAAIRAARFVADSQMHLRASRSGLLAYRVPSSSRRQRMGSKAFFKEITIDRLSRGGALSGRDNHLAISRRHAARGIQTGNARPHTGVDHDFSGLIEGRACACRKTAVVNVTTSGECGLYRQRIAALEIESMQPALMVPDLRDAVCPHGKVVFVKPPFM